MANVLRASAILIIFSSVNIAQAAEFEAHPSLAVSEEFTDNVLESNVNRVSDFITRVQPGLAMTYNAPMLTGDLTYVFDYRNYAKNNHDDEIAHALSAKANLNAVKDLLFLEVSDEYQRVSLDATRDTTKESLFVNQSDRNIVTASPYFILHPSQRMLIKTGYKFMDTRYFKSVAIDKTNHIGYLDMAYELSKRFNLTANYTFTRETADVDNYRQHQALGGFRYEYSDQSFLFAQAGNAWTRYDSGQHLNKLIWNAGITQVFNTVTCTVTTGVRYDEDPLRNIMQETFVSGIITQKLNRGSLSFSPGYSEYVLTKTNYLQTKKYGATVNGQYDFTASFSGRLGVTAERYQQPQLGSYTRRVIVDSGLSYLLARQLSLSLNYIYVDYYSPEIVTDNRHINRAIIVISKTF
ncbi:MAG: TIGR03016 family PEP-CTERM system-associated outer membrane protein [Geobacteraceae bacterium]|nr:TIGR03016 family PEP-CTERM system-associated outer membrane protein [Geobacteraceae bacterium]